MINFAFFSGIGEVTPMKALPRVTGRTSTIGDGLFGFTTPAEQRTIIEAAGSEQPPSPTESATHSGTASDVTLPNEGRRRIDIYGHSAWSRQFVGHHLVNPHRYQLWSPGRGGAPTEKFTILGGFRRVLRKRHPLGAVSNAAPYTPDVLVGWLVAPAYGAPDTRQAMNLGCG